MLLIIDDKLRSHTRNSFDDISEFMQDNSNIEFTDSILPSELDRFKCIAVHASIDMDILLSVTDYCVKKSIKKVVFSGGTNGVLLDNDMLLRINDTVFYNWLKLFVREYELNGEFDLNFFLK